MYIFQLFHCRAEGVYQSMKAKYGVHSCHLLRINSVTPNPDQSTPTESLPDPWSNFIKPSLVSVQSSSYIDLVNPLMDRPRELSRSVCSHRMYFCLVGTLLSNSAYTLFLFHFKKWIPKSGPSVVILLFFNLFLISADLYACMQDCLVSCRRIYPAYTHTFSLFLPRFTNINIILCIFV